MKTTALRLAAVLPLALAGCQNPFDPQADLRMLQWNGLNGGNVILIDQTKASTDHLQPWDDSHNNIIASIGNYSSVPVVLRSYTVVYRQVGEQSPPCSLPAGNAICRLGGAAGRRFVITQHVAGMTSYGAGFAETNFRFRPLTDEVFAHIAADLNTINGGIDMEILFHGTDHNGHDVKVGGSIHIEIK